MTCSFSPFLLIRAWLSMLKRPQWNLIIKKWYPASYFLRETAQLWRKSINACQNIAAFAKFNRATRFIHNVSGSCAIFHSPKRPNFYFARQTNPYLWQRRRWKQMQVQLFQQLQAILATPLETLRHGLALRCSSSLQRPTSIDETHFSTRVFVQASRDLYPGPRLSTSLGNAR